MEAVRRLEVSLKSSSVYSCNSLFRIARQEKLLQGLMTEIVRMTSQMHPLEMGVRLYPFSHSGIFPIPKYTHPQEAPNAPLPDSSSYEEQTSSPTILGGLGGTPPISSMSVPMSSPPMSSHSSVHVTGWHSRVPSSPSGRAVHAPARIPTITRKALYL